MQTYTICFQVTGGISVEAESEDAALEYFWSDAGQEAVGMCLSQNEIDVTEILDEETVNWLEEVKHS